MAANTHTNKLKQQNYAYEIKSDGTLGYYGSNHNKNYWDMPSQDIWTMYPNGFNPATTSSRAWPIIEAMDIDWRP